MGQTTPATLWLAAQLSLLIQTLPQSKSFWKVKPWNHHPMDTFGPFGSKTRGNCLTKKNSSCCTTHHMCYWHHLVYERTSTTTSHASRATWRENLSEWMKKWIPTAKPREFACYNLTNSMLRDSFPAVSQVHYVHPDWLRWMNKLRRWHIRTTAWLEQAGRPCAFQRSCWP